MTTNYHAKELAESIRGADAAGGAMVEHLDMLAESVEAMGDEDRAAFLAALLPALTSYRRRVAVMAGAMDRFVKRVEGGG